MEFFRERPCRARPDALQAVLRLDNLPDWCAPVERVLEVGGDRGRMWTVWGEFVLHREPIRHGVRISLPECPNALQWTVTVEEEHGRPCLRVHVTINRRSHDPDFVASLEQVAEQACEGAVRLLASLP